MKMERLLTRHKKLEEVALGVDFFCLFGFTLKPFFDWGSNFLHAAHNQRWAWALKIVLVFSKFVAASSALFTWHFVVTD